jgi:hypothetical protein
MSVSQIQKQCSVLLCSIAAVCFFLPGCTNQAAQSPTLPNVSELPEKAEFYIIPKQDYYRPYNRVKLNLGVKDRGTFQKDLHIKSKEISWVKLTPLTTTDSEYTYHVNWTGIHRNSHGQSGRTTRITWYLPNNWAGIVPQVPGEYRVQFNISTPAGYWQTEEFLFKIHVPAEEMPPYNDLLASQCNLFLEYEYVVRIYQKNWSSYDDCPRIQLPYEELEEFVKKYPYSSFTRSFLSKLQKTRRVLKNPSTDYDVGDMDALERILGLIEAIRHGEEDI